MPGSCSPSAAPRLLLPLGALLRSLLRCRPSVQLLAFGLARRCTRANDGRCPHSCRRRYAHVRARAARRPSAGSWTPAVTGPESSAQPSRAGRAKAARWLATVRDGGQWLAMVGSGGPQCALLSTGDVFGRQQHGQCIISHPFFFVAHTPPHRRSPLTPGRAAPARRPMMLASCLRGDATLARRRTCDLARKLLTEPAPNSASVMLRAHRNLPFPLPSPALPSPPSTHTQRERHTHTPFHPHLFHRRPCPPARQLTG